jgi:hypothetical protein
VTEIRYIPASRLRWAIYRAIRRIARSGDKFGWRSPSRLALLTLGAIPLSLATLVVNLGIRATATPPAGLWSSVFLILRPTGRQAPPLPRFVTERGTGRRATVAVAPRSIAEALAAPAAATSEEASTSAPQEQDPAQIARVLARYRFVGQLLDIRNDVAEYGGGDRLGAAIVSSKVRSLTLHGPDPIALADLHTALSENISVAVRPDDILAGPLPRLYDAIYLLDSFERISRDDEDGCVRHLCDSLRHDHGVVILGNTSSGAGSRAPDNRTVLRKTVELKALLERYFHVVLPFSMVDDVIRPGCADAADYALAVCCSRKSGP